MRIYLEREKDSHVPNFTIDSIAIVNHYKIPYETTSITEYKSFLFVTYTRWIPVKSK